MGTEKGSESWVLMVTGRSPTNIAVIKYWGKRDESLILPINDSISVTLDPEHLCTTTTVAVTTHGNAPRVPQSQRATWTNPASCGGYGRFQACLRKIRNQANEVVDEKRGIRVSKEDWQKIHLHIASYNNFPTAAGLASSAAVLACFVFSLAKLMNLNEGYGELSAIARQGSGSACRSLYGGFVKWVMGNDALGRDSIAVRLADESHWNDLVILIAMVSSRQKETSSTSGTRESVETSPLLGHRSKAVVPSRIVQMEVAIRTRNFSAFARLTCVDSNQFHATCLDTSPPIFYMNDTSHRIISCIERWNRSEGTPQVAYTFDAGPNAVLISPNRKTAIHLIQRMLYYFPPPPNTNLSSYVLGENTILHEAGLQSMDAVEALEPPPEALDKPISKLSGEVSYFICTRPGRGPVLLADEKDALLHPQTGLPK